MAYTTTAKVKSFLGITWSDQDTLIGELITDAEAIINSLFHVDSFEEASRTDTVKCNYDEQVYYMYNMPVSSIDQVNGTAYTWVINDDYKIVRDRQVIFRTTLSSYISTLKFEFFDIVYTAGYATIPDWLDTMTKLTVWGLYNERKAIGLVEYSLGDERIRFRDKIEASKFEKLFNAHKKIDLWF